MWRTWRKTTRDDEGAGRSYSEDSDSPGEATKSSSQQAGSFSTQKHYIS